MSKYEKFRIRCINCGYIIELVECESLHLDLLNGCPNCRSKTLGLLDGRLKLGKGGVIIG